MQKVFMPEAVRRMDRAAMADYLIPGMVLMEHAAGVCLEALRERIGELAGREVLILCGGGNNGGDGLALARLLDQAGARPAVVMLGAGEALSGDAAANWRILGRLGVPIRQAQDIAAFDAAVAGAKPAVVVDALLGTGIAGTVRPLFAHAISWINRQGAPVLAVDIPSGVDAATGAACGCAVRADVTATFQVVKPGHLLGEGAQACGQLRVGEISLPRALWQEGPWEVLQAGDAARLLPVRPAQGHKGTFGHVVVCAGSPGMMGAGILSARAAARMGCGLVSLAVMASQVPVCQSQASEIMAHALPEREGQLAPEAGAELAAFLRGKQALAIGPGWGRGNAMPGVLLHILEQNPCPAVIDADALFALSGRADALRGGRPLVLTPHPMEMARLTGQPIADILADPIGAAVDFAARYQVTLLLKGATTVVADPAGHVTFNRTGNDGMATGGSGDVLTGVIASLLAQGLPPYEAARLGAYIHGLAGDEAALSLGRRSLLAGDLIGCLPQALLRLEALIP